MGERLRQATDRSGGRPPPPPPPPFPPLGATSGSAASFMTSRCHLLPALPAAAAASRGAARKDGPAPRREIPAPGGRGAGRGVRAPGPSGACRRGGAQWRRGSRRPGRAGPGAPLRVAVECRRGRRGAVGGGGAAGPRSGVGERAGRRDALHSAAVLVPLVTLSGLAVAKRRRSSLSMPQAYTHDPRAAGALYPQRGAVALPRLPRPACTPACGPAPSRRGRCSPPVCLTAGVRSVGKGCQPRYTCVFGCKGTASVYARTSLTVGACLLHRAVRPGTAGH